MVSSHGPIDRSPPLLDPSLAHAEPGRARRGRFGGPIGLGFGVAYAIVAASAIHARENPSHEGVDRALLISGVWLALASAGVMQWGTQAPSLVPASATLAVGAVCAAAASARLVGRARWLRRVSAGRERAFRIEPRTGSDDERDLLPIRPAVMAPEGVVTHRQSATGDPYRTTPHWTPVALADLP